jgi:ribosomal protein S28E/S33
MCEYTQVYQKSICTKIKTHTKHTKSQRRVIFENIHGHVRITVVCFVYSV